jgi:hypothetical protein
MNDIFELWSLPWHALQRDLALGLAGETLLSVPVPKAVKGPSAAAGAAHSWLSRALRQSAPPPQVRR